MKKPRGGARPGSGPKPKYSRATTFSVRMELAHKIALKVLAEKKGTTITEEINNAVRAYVDNSSD